jgi:hypothetical protein
MLGRRKLEIFVHVLQDNEVVSIHKIGVLEVRN